MRVMKLTPQDLMLLQRCLNSRICMRIHRLLHERGCLNISTIKREAGCSHTRAVKHLETLKQLGVVDEEQYHRLRRYRIKRGELNQLLAQTIREMERVRRKDG